MTDEDRQFIRCIDDKKLRWKFHVVGDMQIVGTVVDYLMNGFGTPITIMVFTGRRPAFEIPWTSIQAIQREVK